MNIDPLTRSKYTMITNFSEELAVEFGLDIAVFLENIAYWIRKNSANEKHFYDGRFWSYNSYPAFKKIFPIWSIQSIRTIIRKCVQHNLIIIGNYNLKDYDNTNWYTLSDKGLSYFPRLRGLVLNTPVDSNSTPVEINRPIPKEINTIRKDNNNISDLPKVSEKEIIEAYHEVLPDNPKIKVADRKLSSQLKDMVKGWPKYSAGGKSFTIEGFKAFLSAIKLHQPRFLRAYETKEGNKRQNNLRTITREVNLAKLINGEFNFK